MSLRQKVWKSLKEKKNFLNICSFPLHFLSCEDNDLLNPIKTFYWQQREHKLQGTRKLMSSFDINAFIFCVLFKDAVNVYGRTAGEW
jgi:hypothetical protein